MYPWTKQVDSFTDHKDVLVHTQPVSDQSPYLLKADGIASVKRCRVRG